ncbi:bromodomain-containing protein DDB_G0278469 isoform X2 [Drosophila serrata]|uniref:bromodomain-containing protein DDB_G0278469 isoform X2 n=1 Tax=Drosophila serrata TaxID=7274 RepID=UPI000A1D2925|nr:bromodomain-containing protein DDB_G0278469 isoform X2 [Drosophila serrata]
MVVVVAAADVVENSSSSSGSGSGSGSRTVNGIEIGNYDDDDQLPAALTPASAIGTQQATVANNNHTDKEKNTTTTVQQVEEEQEQEQEEEEEQVESVPVADNNNTNYISDNIANNNTNISMTDAAAKGNGSDAIKASTTAATNTSSMGSVSGVAVPTKSAVSQRNVDIKIEKTSNMEAATQQLTKKVLKLDLGGKNLDEYSLKSPKSPIAARLPHQTSLTSSVDVEDRKTLREALYQGIFHRHRRTIFAVGSFLRMLRSRNSQYNTIRSSSEGEDIDEFLKRRGSKLLRFPHLFDR